MTVDDLVVAIMILATGVSALLLWDAWDIADLIRRIDKLEKRK